MARSFEVGLPKHCKAQRAPVPPLIFIQEDNNFDLTFDVESLPNRPEIEKYHASKIAAHKAVIDFVAANNPPFDIATIHPIYVFGHSLVQETAGQLNGTNRLLFLSLMSGTLLDGQFIGVHVDDVAIAHVRALTRSGSTINGVQSYLVSCKKHSWQKVFDFVKLRYPNVPIKLNPVDSTDYMVDTTRAERELGIEFRQMEEQVADVMDQQLGLRG